MCRVVECCEREKEMSHFTLLAFASSSQFISHTMMPENDFFLLIHLLSVCNTCKINFSDECRHCRLVNTVNNHIIIEFCVHKLMGVKCVGGKSASKKPLS